MSDNIPFEIQEEIMKRLPIKPLLQFRLVSKAWKSLIDSSEFIAAYQHTELQHHILVRDDFEYNYVSVVDDDTFPHQKVTLTVPMSVTQLYKPEIIGSSQGLFCFYGRYVKPTDSGMVKAVIWNPTIRKSVAIDVPYVLDSWKYAINVGFGVCPRTLDPMFVKVLIKSCADGINSSTDTTWCVEVFRLSSGTWKSLSINLPRITITFNSNQVGVAIERFIYWHALDRISGSDLIISFDMISEEFREIRLPDDLALNLGDWEMQFYLCKFKESLVVIHFQYVVETDWDVWMMENGDPESFRKIYTIRNGIREDDTIVSVFGSKKSGEPLVEVTKCSYIDSEIYDLFVYHPNSEQIDHIGISAKQSSFFVSAYIETLLLLDREDCISTFDINRG